MSIETTDLDHRVHVHGLILQALVAQMNETAPQIMQRLQTVLTLGQDPGGDQRDVAATERYARQFVRQSLALGANGSSHPEDESATGAQIDTGSTMPASSRAVSPID